MNVLKDLPNRRGFRFVGVNLEGEKVMCTVDLDAVGCYSVFREDNGAPYFMSLVGWESILGSPPAHEGDV